jgi:predicted metal-dependent hydrolase
MRRGLRSELPLEELMAPQTVIDYIVAHEFCHLRFRRHSDAFWNGGDKVMPRYRERKKCLG